MGVGETEDGTLGDHTIGGGRDPESGLIYIYISMYINMAYFNVCKTTCTYMLE